jgi:hypothetical protein
MPRPLLVAALMSLAACPGPVAPAPIGNLARPPIAVAVPGRLIAGAGAPVVRGVITREMTRFTRNDPFVASAGAILAIELRRYEGEDTPAPLVAAGTIELPVGATLPFAYELRAAPGARAAGATYFVSAAITAIDASGAPFKLMSEYRNELADGADALDFTVSGLESCASPDAGGFCG